MTCIAVRAFSTSSSDLFLPCELGGLPVGFVLARESDPVGLDGGLVDAVVLDLQVDPEPVLVLPGQRGAQDLRQPLPEVQGRHADVLKVLCDLR